MLHAYVTAVTCPSILEELQAARTAYWAMTPAERVGETNQSQSYVATLTAPWQRQWLSTIDCASLPTAHQTEVYFIRNGQARYIGQALRILGRLRSYAGS